MQTKVFDTKLIQIGRSLAIKLPPDYVKRVQLRKGQLVDLSIDHERGVSR